MSNSIGVRWTSSPARVTPLSAGRPRGRLPRSPGRHRRRPARRSTARKSRQQLLRPERLRYVVVCAGVERAHLLALVSDSREHDDRKLLQIADLSAHVHAASVRQEQGRAPSRRVGASTTASSASLLGLGSLDLVARARRITFSPRTICGSSSTTKHALGGGHAARAGCGTSGKDTANEVSSPVPDCMTDAPTIRLHEATAYRQAQARAMASSRPWTKGSKMRVRSERRNSAAAIGDPHGHPAGAGTRADSHRLPGRRELHGVLDQVREDSLELNGIGTNQRQVGGQSELDRMVAMHALAPGRPR